MLIVAASLERGSAIEENGENGDDERASGTGHLGAPKG
jgi:hypothetical protein